MTSTTEPTQWQISITDESLTSEIRNVNAPTITIGKLSTVDLTINDINASRNHCRLELTGNAVQVSDLGSTNGTFLHGERQKSFQLNLPTDSFQIGTTTLSVLRVENGADPFVHAEGLSWLHRLHSDFIKTTDSRILSHEDRTREALEEYLQRIDPTVPLWISRFRLKARLIAEVTGLGPLEPHFHNPEVTEIMVNGADKVYLIKRGKIELTAERFINNDSVYHCIQRIIAPIGRSLDDHTPMVDARIPGKARLNAIIPPLSLVGPCLTLRKSGSSRLDMSGLITANAISEAVAGFLQIAVANHCNIIVAGATDTGKTTMLNILSSYIDPCERVITIEDTAELLLRQPHVISLETRPANLEGSGAITIRDLVKNSLRMRPNRLVIGECRGGEALDMLQAMNTGHDGSMTTLHANSPRDTLARLETMALMAGLDLPLRSIREQVSSAIDLIVFLARTQEGKRIITHVTEVGNMEEQIITSHDLFIRSSGGDLAPTGIIPKFMEVNADAAQGHLAFFSL